MQLYARPTGFRQPDRDHLLRRSGAMLALTNVLDLFANKLSCLRARSLPFALVFLCAFQCLFVRHGSSFRFFSENHLHPLSQAYRAACAIARNLRRHNQPPANPARRKPLEMYGQCRINRHKKPVR